MDTKYFSSLEEWRKWLKKNHNRSDGIWFLYYKGDKAPSVHYEDSVLEALCWGWIDSIIKRLDDDRYVRKFTPRKKSSNWSEKNKKRVSRLISEGRMKAPGMSLVEEAKANGEWFKKQLLELPFELEELLGTCEVAKKNYDELPPSHKKRYNGWIGSAKRDLTRRKRAAEAFDMLKRGERLGMK